GGVAPVIPARAGGVPLPAAQAAVAAEPVGAIDVAAGPPEQAFGEGGVGPVVVVAVGARVALPEGMKTGPAAGVQHLVHEGSVIDIKRLLWSGGALRRSFLARPDAFVQRRNLLLTLLQRPPRVYHVSGEGEQPGGVVHLNVVLPPSAGGQRSPNDDVHAGAGDADLGVGIESFDDALSPFLNNA